MSAHGDSLFAPDTAHSRKINFFMTNELSSFLNTLKKRYPAETEFHQAVTEVAKSVWPFLEKNPKFQKAKILERMAEPERVIMFRVTWTDRKGEVQINRG